MKQEKTYEQYPLSTVMIANGLNLSIYALGAIVLSGLGWFWVGAYLFLFVWNIGSLWNGSCRHCYYYGKQCGTGMGKLCAKVLQPGDPVTFAKKEMSWVQVLPDLLVLFVPLIGGVVRLIQTFSWGVVALLLVLVLLSFAGNGMVRSTLLCPYCKQRVLGCPAEKLFKKQNA